MQNIDAVLGFAIGIFVGICWALWSHAAYREKLGAKQAKIDWLMLEFCPDEMTPAQIEEWGRHQKPAPGCTFCESVHYACSKCPVCGRRTP